MGIEITISKCTSEERVKRCWEDALKDLSREELIDQIRHLYEENRDLKDDAVLTGLRLDKNEIKFVKPYTNETCKDSISILKELKRNGWRFNYVNYGQKIHDIDISLYKESEDVTEFVHVYSYDVEGMRSKLSATEVCLSVEDLTMFKKLMTFLDATC